MRVASSREENKVNFKFGSSSRSVVEEKRQRVLNWFFRRLRLTRKISVKESDEEQDSVLWIIAVDTN